MITHRIARPLLAGTFVLGGIDAFLHPDSKAGKADSITAPLARALGIPDDTRAMVRLNASVQIGAGLLLAAGMLPRTMATSLAASLVPTTLAGHAFWSEPDPRTRGMQRLQFAKNASMLGGLLLAATDHEGRPSVSWRAKRAARHFATSIEDTVSKATATIEDTLDRATANASDAASKVATVAGR